MTVIFLSHASKDDGDARALESWLRANGFEDLFVDHTSIAGGDKWREALRASAGSCRVVLCLITQNWLVSPECFNEYRAAWYMGKRIVPLFRLPAGLSLNEESERKLAEIYTENQGLDIEACRTEDGALDIDANAEVASRLRKGLRAAGALTSVGLDPEAFDIDCTLCPTPFPGLAPFGDDDADAAIFYGRSREIASILEILRSMRALSENRPLVILGASGAGKSSLLRAGVIPRLRRESPAWLPMRAFRPGADPVLNFAEALSRTLADFGKNEAHGVIRDRLLAAWSNAERSDDEELSDAGLKSLEATLEREGRRLQEAANRPGASILLSVDQAEEIARADIRSTRILADYLRLALAATSCHWQLAFTIRTDAFPELQGHPCFQHLEARGYDLRALPVFRFNDVVEEPAKRYGVEIDPAMVDALMEDAPKEDALPLLAFALQRLWRQYAASGTLSEANYRAVGSLPGLIGDAAERALRGLGPEQDVPLPENALPKRLSELGARTFVPALVQINDQGITIRRASEWDSFSDEQKDLLSQFDRWRLVVRKVTDANAGTVELTHEALFREWGRLRDWLKPEQARLETLRALRVAATTWHRQLRAAAFLDHRGMRLAEAKALLTDERYRERLTMTELDYLSASEQADKEARAHRRRARALMAILLLSIVAGAAGWWHQEYLRVQYHRYVIVRPYVLGADAERELKPGDTFAECTAPKGIVPRYCPEMVVVPKGSFEMGSPAAETGHSADETPQHTVIVSRPFAVSKYEVTAEQWEACAAYGPCRPGTGKGLQPVRFVSWRDAQDYVTWLSEVTNKTYRLLSEAEWEYAARAGTTTAYFWGDALGKANANCKLCSPDWDIEKPDDVGSFEPNAFGLHDMHGNIWEWVEDCYHKSYHGAPHDTRPWTDECTDYRRILRGGSWAVAPTAIRAANRNKRPDSHRDLYIGLRIARTP